MRKTLLATLLMAMALVFPSTAVANADRLFLETQCPGFSSRESLAGPLSAIALPLITRAVKSGLNVLSAKLAEAAKPDKTVAAVNIGDYFYRYKVEVQNSGDVATDLGQLQLKHGCLIYAAAPLSQRSKNAETKHSCGGQDVFSPLDGYGGSGDGNSCTLLNYLKKKRYDPTLPPRTLLVSRIELSKDRTAFRLKPIYLFFAASPRKKLEKSSNNNEQKLAFNFTFSRPTSDDVSGQEVFAIPVIEFTEIRSGLIKNDKQKTVMSSYGQEDLTDRSSKWFVLPNPNDHADQSIERDKSIQSSFNSYFDSACQAYHRGLQYEDVITRFRWSAEVTACPNLGLDYFKSDPPPNRNDLCKEFESDSKWRNALQKHQASVWSAEQHIVEIQRAIGVEKDDKKKAEYQASLEQCNVTKRSGTILAEFASACQQALALNVERMGVRESLSIAEPINISLTVVQHHDKPFLSFLASILGDEDTRKELTTAITKTIDPVERAAALREKQKEHREAIVAYDAAVVDAQKKELDYIEIDGAKEVSKAKAEIDMNAAKRKANRLAHALGVAVRFPSIGTEVLVME